MCLESKYAKRQELYKKKKNPNKNKISKSASNKRYNSLVSILRIRKMLEDEKYLSNPLPFRKKE